MKTILLIAFLLYHLSPVAQFHIGARTGINIPALNGNNEQTGEYNSRLDIYGGLFVNFRINSSLYLQPEVNFSPQGGKRKGMQPVPPDVIRKLNLVPGTTLYANIKSTILLNYIEIPVLVKLILGEKFRYYEYLGPYIAFLTEAKTIRSGYSQLFLDSKGVIPLMVNGSPSSLSFNNETDINSNVKTINTGFQGGLGLEYPLGPGIIFLEGRAIIGVTNIQTHPGSYGRNQTSSLAFTAGFFVKIK